MKQTICANLIVKDEAHVIQRCLDSLVPWVEAFCIVDTGSTDGTLKLLKRPNIILYQRSWVNFGHNRQEALELARPLANYILFIDADDVLETPPNFCWPSLSLPGYTLPIHYADLAYNRCSLVRSDAPWRWEGVVHEYLTSDMHLEQGHLKQPTIKIVGGGARALDPNTYKKDIELLEKAEPTPRNVFYLAQSYRDAGELKKALTTYERRMAMLGWDEESWEATYEAAKLKERLEWWPHEVTRAYLAAFQQRPTRAEPLFQLARYYRLRGEHALAWLYAKAASEVPYPADRLFVDCSVYDWRCLDELGIAGYYTGHLTEGRKALETLLASGKLPEAEAPRVLKNLEFYK